MSTMMTSPRFPLGRVVATPGALNALRQAGQSGYELLRRHASGDWGDVPPEDAAENELSVRQGFRILSNYQLGISATIWIITEADRSATTILCLTSTEATCDLAAVPSTSAGDDDNQARSKHRELSSTTRFARPLEH